MSGSSEAQTGVEIAVVGMAGRFPDAPDVEVLWRNVCDGVESVRPLSDASLRACGVAAAALADPSYVKNGVVLPDVDLFDADFFGYSPREAERIDPQQRLFLETAWQALEHAGYGAGAGSALVGVYAGSGPSLYLLRHLLPSIDLCESDIASLLGLLNGSDHDSLATRVAYKLDLRGPAVCVQTACSTSLAAVHLACRGLLNHEADMALAGGVWLDLLQGRGYRYQPGAILSPDGHCRAFDAEAAGTTIGSGVGVVVLKRLAEAIADGDTIHAVIKGSAINNDGAAKVGYTAPSVDGQTAVVLAALAMADVGAETIDYVEAHGTGTMLGDPIEIAALTEAFRAGSERKGYCAIGSVKTNVGHLDAAAGVTALIKTVMALERRILPPSRNFERPNPQIDFANGPFYVNTEAKPWPKSATPRRAGVSSFGMGGTNVHLVLEEAPSASDGVDAPESVASSEGLHALMLSTGSASSLEAARLELARHLELRPDQRIADVAYTLREGRKRFDHRAVALVRDREEAIRALTRNDPTALFKGEALSARPTVAFLFPGQGAQHVDMGRALYERDIGFRETVDHCCELLRPHLGQDLRALLYSVAGEADAAARLARTDIAQPALFVVEYALAQWWMRQGVRPDAMLGHSVGEYVAACVAGVFALEDALAVIAARGRLMQAMEPGAMLTVGMPEAELPPDLADCELAAVNASDVCVLSGPTTAIDSAERALAGRGVAVRRLHVSRAFHSVMVEPMLGAFEALLSCVALSAPHIPFVSNLSGRWITADEARDPSYWARHLRGVVRFADGLDELLAKPDRVLLEVGPGETLSALARRHPGLGRRPALASQRHPRQAAQDADQPARCLAQLWIAGVDVEAADLSRGVSGRRVPLPTYPFERRSYWVEAPKERSGATADKPGFVEGNIADWFYAPTWKCIRPPSATSGERRSGCILVMGDSGDDLTERLHGALQVAAGRVVVRAERGPEFARLGERRYAVRIGARDDMEQLLRHIDAEAGPLSDICHLWNVDLCDTPPPDEALERGFFSLLALAQALGATGGRKVSLTVVASRLGDVTGAEPSCPEKATLLGPCKVIPQEYPHIACRVIDVRPPTDSGALERLARQIAAEIGAPVEESIVAYRGAHRWARTFEPLRIETPSSCLLRKNGVYLITGGLGGVGLALARYLAERWQARLALVGRNILPDQTEAAAELEALGAEVLILRADVTEATRSCAVVDETRRRFGDLHGVVHAAGVAGGGMIAQRQRVAVEQVFAPKIRGVRNLLAALEGKALDFVLLCSSLSAVTGDFGQVDYCAANSFLDALASDETRRGKIPILSVNWDAWRGVGMAASQRLPDGVGIAPTQAGPLLERLLSDPLGARVLISTIDLDQQFVQARGPLANRLSSVLPTKQRAHPRPALQTIYVPPSDELEGRLLDLWEEFLGFSSIGVEDNFFELGGDSLLAIQLLAKVSHAYGVEIHPAAFFERPTIAALALLVEESLIEEIETEAVDPETAQRSSATV